MTYSMLYNERNYNFQSDFDTLTRIKWNLKENKKINWAVVVEIATGKIVAVYRNKKFKKVIYKEN